MVIQVLNLYRLKPIRNYCVPNWDSFKSERKKEKKELTLTFLPEASTSTVRPPPIPKGLSVLIFLPVPQTTAKEEARRPRDGRPWALADATRADDEIMEAAIAAAAASVFTRSSSVMMRLTTA